MRDKASVRLSAATPLPPAHLAGVPVGRTPEPFSRFLRRQTVDVARVPAEAEDEFIRLLSETLALTKKSRM